MGYGHAEFGGGSVGGEGYAVMSDVGEECAGWEGAEVDTDASGVASGGLALRGGAGVWVDWFGCGGFRHGGVLCESLRACERREERRGFLQAKRC